MAGSAAPPLTQALVRLSEHWHICRGRLKRLAQKQSDTEEHDRTHEEADSAYHLHPFPDFLDRVVLLTGVDKVALRKAVSVGFSNCQSLVADLRKVENTPALNQLYAHVVRQHPTIAARCGLDVPPQQSENTAGQSSLTKPTIDRNGARFRTKADRWPLADTVLAIANQSKQVAGFIRDALPTTACKRPFGANAMPAVITELDRLTYLFYGRTLSDYDADREQTARLGWWISLAGWIVATPGPNEHPALQDGLTERPIRFLHAGYKGWHNPVPTHADGLFRGLVTLRVYFGQIVFSRDSWILSGEWLRQEISARAVGLACQTGAQLGHWFDGELCREPLYLLRKPEAYCAPAELKGPPPIPDEIERCGTLDSPKTDGVPAEWLDTMEHYATKLIEAVSVERKDAKATMPPASYVPIIKTINDAPADAAELVPPTVGGKWTEPKPPSEWTKIFNLGWDTLKMRFDEQVIRNQKLSSKSYRVLVDDLPATSD